MKWKKRILNIFILMMVFGIIGLEVSYLYFYMPTIFIQKDESKIETYHQNLQTIKENLDAIALPSEDGILDWAILKNKDKEKENYISIVRYLRLYYMMCTGAGTNRIGDGSSYTDSQFLEKNFNKKAVSEKEWKSLMKTYQRVLKESLNPFIDYENFFPYPLDEKLKETLQKIADYNQNIKENQFKTYEEVLENEVKESELMKDLSKQIKSK